MSEIETHFDWYDAWILLALIYNHERGPSSLKDILATADAINHAVPTREELNNALNRLHAAGYIVEHEGDFDVTEAARTEYSRITKPRTPMLDELERMKDVLAKHAPPASVPRRVNITASSLDAAYAASSRAFRDEYGKF